MKMTEFCDHLYDESTDGYIQILKLDDKNNSDERTIKIYNTKNIEYQWKTLYKNGAGICEPAPFLY